MADVTTALYQIAHQLLKLVNGSAPNSWLIMVAIEDNINSSQYCPYHRQLQYYLGYLFQPLTSDQRSHAQYHQACLDLVL